jgi:tetratricopeptide (TPR) repeat protein
MASFTPALAFWRLTGFRSIIVWVLASFVLLSWQYHRQQALQATTQFTVSMEGRSPLYRAELNGSVFDAGSHSGLGHKRLTLRAANAELFVTNVFVWYGGKNLGNLSLTRSRGMLDFSITSAARRFTVTGQETNGSFGSTTHEILSLPTGRYKLTTEFTRFTSEQDIEIFANQTHRVSINPFITALRLDSQPTDAEFHLTSITTPGISIRSNTPVLLAEMPTGKYELAIWKGDYRKTMPVALTGSEGTNELMVEFDYASISVTSTPPGAQVLHGARRLGVTPAILNLPPGSYRLDIFKEGFQGTNVSLTLTGNATNTLMVTLPNLALLQAMERARQELSAFNYERALTEVETALQIEPEDEDARALKRTIQFNQCFTRAKQFAANRDYSKALADIDAALKLNPDHKEALAFKSSLEKAKQEAEQLAAEARRHHPEKVFQAVASRLPNNELFEPQLMRFTNSLKAVSAGLVRALGRNPEWNVSPTSNPDMDTAVIHAGIKSFASRKNVVLVVGQTTDSEVALYFKLFEYTLDTKIQVSLGGVSDDSYTPLHPQRVSALRAPFVEKQRAASIQEFKKRIEDELR